LMIAGNFDLSVGSILGLASGICILLLNAGVPALVALALTLAVAAVIGAVNGFLVTRLRIHSLIVTLGALMFYRAVVLALTKGFPLRLAEEIPMMDLFSTRLGFVPVSFLWMLGVVAAFAGILQLARFNSIDALRGDGMELEAILAAVVGGASLNGGYGSVIGAVLGVFMLAMIKQGLILMGIDAYWYRAGIGLVLIGAAVVTQYVRERNA
jgi:simple sugar transport system permease protein